MTSAQQRSVCAALVVILPVLAGWALLSYNAPSDIGVRVVEIGFVKATGFPVFTIQNASPVPVLRSPAVGLRRAIRRGRRNERNSGWEAEPSCAQAKWSI